VCRKRCPNRHLHALANSAAERMHAIARSGDDQAPISPCAVRDGDVAYPYEVTSRRPLQLLHELLIRAETIRHQDASGIPSRCEILSEGSVNLHSTCKSIGEPCEHQRAAPDDEEVVGVAAPLLLRIDIDPIEGSRNLEFVC